MFLKQLRPPIDGTSSWFLRIGMARGLALAVAFSVLFSILICYAIYLASNNGESFREWIVAAILTPLIISPIVAYTCLSLAHRLRETQEALHKAATTDLLTGIANRRYLLNYAATVLSSTNQEPRPLSLLLIDIDHFKSINDTCGHAVGDEAIVAVAAACRSRLRNIDLFGRWGGEEFLALLDGCDAEGAWRVAESLRGAVEAMRLPNCPCPLTISIGVATTSGSQNPKVFDQMLSLADQQLYRAKKLGRNRVMPKAA
jgi:diguanylate cyclase (GGDEF)-like protein